MVCKNCGKELREDEKFCGGCGTKAGETAVLQVGNRLDKKELCLNFTVLGIYTGLGLALVSLFMIFKGFGLIKREINVTSVGWTLGISLGVAVICGVAFFLIKKLWKNKK